MMTRSEALANLAAAGQALRTAVQDMDAFEGTPQWKRLHRRLNLLACEAEAYFGVTDLGGVHTDGGEPK